MQPIFARLRETVSGIEYTLHDGINVIGHGTASDINVPDVTVSFQQAYLTVTQEGVFVEHLGSIGSTRINGKSVPPGYKLRLMIGDVLSIGNTNLMFDFPLSAKIQNNQLAQGTSSAAQMDSTSKLSRLLAIASICTICLVIFVSKLMYSNWQRSQDEASLSIRQMQRQIPGSYEPEIGERVRLEPGCNACNSCC